MTAGRIVAVAVWPIFTTVAAGVVVARTGWWGVMGALSGVAVGAILGIGWLS